MTEALYHSVPMLAMPIFADQLDNAHRIEHQGYGLTLSMQHDLKSEEVMAKVEEVVYNPRWAEYLLKGLEFVKALIHYYRWIVERLRE